MNTLIRLHTHDDGSEHDLAEYWHLADPTNSQGPAILCTQEYYGYGESGCKYDFKIVKKGGITCPDCLEKLKILKGVKL